MFRFRQLQRFLVQCDDSDNQWVLRHKCFIITITITPRTPIFGQAKGDITAVTNNCKAIHIDQQ